MSVLTITAVDHTQDKLTIVGHGRNTGDGPFAVRNLGDGTLPAGLAEVTEYWVIRVDADNMKPASSSANALLGTAVNLTSNGSGTNVVEIGIPYEVARTYVPKSVDAAGAQVKSDDLNQLMISLRALHRFLTGQAQTIWSAEKVEADALYYSEAIPLIIPGARCSRPTGAHTNSNSAAGVTVGNLLDNSADPIHYPIDGLRDGDVITEYSVLIDKASGGTGAYTGVIKGYDSTTFTEGSESPGTGIENFGGPMSPAALSENGLNIAVVAEKQYNILVSMTAACQNDVVYHAIVWVKRPKP